MKKAGIMPKVLVLLLGLALLLSLFGCGSSNGDAQNTSASQGTTQETKGASESSEEVRKEIVHLNILWVEEAGATSINTYKNNPVYKEVERLTGTTFDILGWNNEKLMVSIAGGDLPDIVCATDDNIETLYTSKVIVDLFPLIEKTKSNNLLYAPARIDAAKKMLKTEGFYYITPLGFAADAPSSYPIKVEVGPTLRWDYYKELGCPSIKSLDDLLNVLEQMAQKHPTTPDGKKVYAFANLNDWQYGLWSYTMLANVTGVENLFETIDVRKDDQQIIPEFYGPENPYYQASRLMNKAYRKGLLHPEAFTMKKIDFEAAALRGEILYNGAVYGFEKANLELLKGDNPTSFVTIPFDFGYCYSNVAPRNNVPGYLGGIGMGGKNWCVTTNCKIPERAVEFLDFCFSAEGTRLLTSGVEGVHWEYVDGKPAMKKEIIDLIMEGGEELNKTGILGSQGALAHLRGMGNSVLHPDGAPVNLQTIPSAYKFMMNPVQKDYSETYGVEYPFQAFQKKYEQGLQKFNPDYKTLKYPAMPDDIKRIDTKLIDILVKGLPKTVLEPKTDEEWEKAFNKLRDDLNAAGAQTVVEWAKEVFATARAEAYAPVVSN